MGFTEKYGASVPAKPRVFPATFKGTCYECGDDIVPDDPVAYWDNGLMHEDCAMENYELDT